jgi:hypothetical protein
MSCWELCLVSTITKSFARLGVHCHGGRFGFAFDHLDFWHVINLLCRLFVVFSCLHGVTQVVAMADLKWSLGTQIPLFPCDSLSI